jgi:TolA-binding protein
MRLLILVIILSITGSGIATANYVEEPKDIRSLIRGKNFEQVEKYLDELLISEEPKKIYSEYRSVIVTLEQHCEIEKALEFINKYIVRYPDYSGDDNLYLRQGLFLTDLNRYQEAVESLERFVDNFKGSIFELSARHRLGLIYFRTQEYEKAEYNHKFYMEKEKRITPYGDYLAALDLLDVYFGWGKMEEAKKIIDEGLDLFCKDNKDYRDYYNAYYMKQAEYYFIQKDWGNYKKVNRLPVPFYIKVFLGGFISKFKKMDRIYKYRHNEDFVDAYINHRLWKHEEMLNIQIDENQLDKKQKLALQTMRGVAYYWLNKKEKASEDLKEANRKGNFLLDEASYYAALIEFEKGNYKEAEKELKNYRSLWVSDVPEGTELVRRLDSKFGRLKFFGE